MPDPTRHPLFARLYVRFADAMAPVGADEHRRELLAELHGTVVEVGCGHGANFPHYPPAVTSLVGIEPERFLRAKAVRATRDAPRPTRVVAALADALPIGDASADAVVTSLVLCSVDDQSRALTEIRRVLRSGGELRFYEHVASERRGLGRLQRVVDVVWPLFAGGCHTSRDTVRAITSAGLGVTDVRRFDFDAAPRPVRPHVIGRARRP